MIKKLFLLVILLSFTFNSIAMAATTVVEEEKKLVIYDREGNIVAVEGEGLPLEPKKNGENAVSEIEYPIDAILERPIDAIVVDNNGKEINSVHTDKNISSETIGTKSIGARVATVAIAADEEYRNANSNWVTKTQNLVEKMDDAFIRDHNFDLDIKVFIGWNSEGANASQILGDLRTDWGSQYNYDFLIGFTNETDYEVGGLAYQYSSAPSGMAVSTLKGTQTDSGVWHAGQHEISHNIGLSHDTDTSRCIMNYTYIYDVDIWDTTHNNLITKNKVWYGSAY
ncbi:M12 family metallo-peptidase [Psychrobacillus sp. FSL K6-2684]|uniref:M12 family metallo-peptidase n=1 Tax=unclassified Psychrobacillus TaxID=2636677 RepID=UPI0030F564FC